MLPSPSPICVSSELLLADSTARVMDLAILKLKQNLSNIITDRESKNILILAESDSWFVYRSIVPKKTPPNCPICSPNEMNETAIWVLEIEASEWKKKPCWILD